VLKTHTVNWKSEHLIRHCPRRESA
jgi:hypothetical protein